MKKIKTVNAEDVKSAAYINKVDLTTFDEKHLWDLLENSLDDKETKAIRASLVMLHTGLRPSELQNMLLKDVNLKEGYLVCGKRTIPLNYKIKDIVQTMCENSFDEIHLSEFKNSNSLFQSVNKVLNKFNLKAHDCRRLFYEKLLYAGVSNKIISVLIGHQLSKNTYCKFSLDELSDAVNKIIKEIIYA